MSIWAPATGAYGGSTSHLPHTALAARQKQVRKIGASDQQQECGGARQHEQSCAHVAGQPLSERGYHGSEDTNARVIEAYLQRDRVQVGLRGFACDSTAQPANDQRASRRAAKGIQTSRGEGREVDIRWKNADDGELSVVQTDGLP